ncbi:MAG: homocysteine S-methyltransferase family protein [Oscillospiraceae bacterium]|jgi:5-methyltetrahydrofolate--homocysteine methyltransferase|nr:homocysteine S-methyltransferase family protein [Oscillospiraceae bacterium]
MTVLEQIQNGIFYLDGAMGSYLQSCGLRPGELPETWNITSPEEIIALHRAYYEAGSHAVSTNTFGVNALKFDGRDGRYSVREIVFAAVDCAKKARDTAAGGQKEKFLALDIGPLGPLLAPLGDVSFETAVALFAEVVRAGADAGVDYIFIETMNDCYETKAAVLAAKENCSLPVFVSNVYDESAKLMSGTDPEAMVAMLEGLGADVIGINCSLGPDAMLDILPRLVSAASVPVLVKPNAGLPHAENGKTVYDVFAEEFAEVMQKIVAGGARVAGGCCGTTPEYIRMLVEKTKRMTPMPVTRKKRSVISSYTRAVEFGKVPVLIGERINPTGKKRFKEALRNQEISYILNEGVAQQEQGAHVLDVNVGLPEIDEPAMLELCVKELQGVCDLPLQIDTSDPIAMERAMRIYNGKPMINSVNGSDGSMDAVFPLVKKYGGYVVCLTLDESGIPETAEGRAAIAGRIVSRAAQYGIAPHDLIFDPLAMTISSDQTAAQVTLASIPLIRERYGSCCSLGISNISFGLPNRDFITATFFILALQKGLDAAIMNPFSDEMQKAYHTYMALAALDDNCQGYIGFAQNITVESSSAAKNPAAKSLAGEQGGLAGAIVRGLAADAALFARQSLETKEPLAVINEQIVPALDVVGKGFEEKTVFLPQLLMSAEAAKAAFEEAKKKMPSSDEVGPSVILATVKGDIHDIGKNIVKAIMENYGFHVIDLGRDVPPELVVETAVSRNVKLVGLSALMTTTVPAMAETIRQLKEKKPGTLVMVGGAVLTQEYADMIGADFYGKNAMESVRYAERVFKK